MANPKLSNAFLLSSDGNSGKDNMADIDKRSDDLVDPDPFLFGTALLGMIFAGVSYLDSRRQTSLMELQLMREDDRYRRRFRQKYFASERALFQAREVTDQFESRMIENDFADSVFAYGERRLFVSRDQVRGLRGLVRRIHSVADSMSMCLDELSEFLGPEHQRNIDRIHERVREQQRPHTYDALVLLANDAIDLYAELLDDINEQEQFSNRMVGPQVQRRSGR